MRASLDFQNSNVAGTAMILKNGVAYISTPSNVENNHFSFNVKFRLDIVTLNYFSDMGFTSYAYIYHIWFSMQNFSLDVGLSNQSGDRPVLL